MIMETLRREKGRDLMTNTVTRTAARATDGAQQAGREQRDGGGARPE
jgi:hypothetical protein